MELKIIKEKLFNVDIDLAFVLCFAKDEGDGKESPTLLRGDDGKEIDQRLHQSLSKIIQRQEFKGNEGETLLVYSIDQVRPTSILLVGAGSEKNFSLETLRRIGAKVGQVANINKVHSVAGVLEAASFKGLTPAARLEAFCEGLLLSQYTFDAFKENPTKRTLQKIFVSFQGNAKLLDDAWKMAKLYAAATNITRDLVNLPPNELTPTVLAKKASEFSKGKNVTCRIYNEKEIRAEKMGGILAVSQGSVEPPAFVHLTYKPKGKSKMRVALIGKGITYDSGGINIKTRDLEFMKCDMGGAASVIGIFHALTQLDLDITVDGFIAAAENMCSGSAIRPGDIITTRSGKTIEIWNTDAEGRVVLADAIDFAADFNPTYMIDMATLTGGAAYALGELITPVLGNDKKLIEKILQAAKAAGEPAWELPIIPEYKKGYKKGPADIKNSGSGSKASTICGALFLEEFVRKNKWAHMDVASTVWADEPRHYHLLAGATGTPTRTLIKFLLDL